MILTSSKIWLFWTMMSLFAYGLWGIFNSLTSSNTDPYTGIFLSSLGYLLTGIIALNYIGFKPIVTGKGIACGLSLGLATGLGGLFFLMSLNKGGNINNVVSITAVYPLATLLFSFIMLNQSLNIKQVIGVCCSVLAVILLSS